MGRLPTTMLPPTESSTSSGTARAGGVTKGRASAGDGARRVGGDRRDAEAFHGGLLDRLAIELARVAGDREAVEVKQVGRHHVRGQLLLQVLLEQGLGHRL